MVKNKKELSLYDVSVKEKFIPDSYEIVNKNGRRMAKAKNPDSGTICYRILGEK